MSDSLTSSSDLDNPSPLLWADDSHELRSVVHFAVVFFKFFVFHSFTFRVKEYNALLGATSLHNIHLCELSGFALSI